MKKVYVIMMCMTLCLCMMTACGDGGTPADTGDEEISEETYVIRIASNETIDTPCSEATLIFKDLVEEASEGRVTVEYFYDSALGDEREIAESVNMGNLEMGIISGALLATYAPDWYVTDLPYVFLDRKMMYSHLDGEVGDFLKKALMDSSNIETLDYADGSFRVILNAKKPIKSVSDLKGLKIRCMENKINMSLYNAWDSTAIPMSFSEVYTALQQGTIDGVDTSPLYIRSGKFYEAAKYYTLTNHQPLLMITIINTDYINGLPEDIQKIIRDCSHEAYTVQERQIVEEAEEYACSVMDESGCIEYVLSDEELKTFIEGSKAVIEEYSTIIDPALYEILGL